MSTSPLSLTFSDVIKNNYSQEKITSLISEFKNHERYDFVRELKNETLISSVKNTYERFKHFKSFAQVGIGGSSLGPEMLISALGSEGVKFTFFNNIDADDTYQKLQNLNIKETLFYIVSKSGGTAETMATFSIIANKLVEAGVKEENFKDHFVFATDPKKSSLLELGKEFGITCLEIPPFVGGRFSVLTPVGTLPALFAGIDIDSLLAGAYKYATEQFDSEDFKKTCASILTHAEEGVNETILMPYSSLLRDLSFWFVQLWGESLGKKKDNQRVGLTPIPSYGATDQHSQMQLFMEGPLNKFLFLIHVKNTKNDFKLENSFNHSRLKMLSSYSLKDLMDAEFFGTLKALNEQGVPHLTLSIDLVNEESLGAIIVYFELLTAIIGNALGIDPFDQPGVEAGKIYSFEWLEKLK